MMSCQEVRRLAADFLGLELRPEEDAAVRQHLMVCAACRDALAAEEPALALVWPLAQGTGPEDDRFVGEVLAGVHQRQLEHRLGGSWRRTVALAAALLLAVLGGAVGVRHLGQLGPAVVAKATPLPESGASPGRPNRHELAFVEVENAGVRLYQVTPPSDSRQAMQVAFIVDPHVEL